MQLARTSDLIFDLPTMIAQLSEFTELRPGDVIATGSPAGVALHRDPPPWLKPGDEVGFAVEGIGRMEHEVVDESG
jgi:acylpyruvate hydrolase